MPTGLIIGASSGIGLEMAKDHAARGYARGLVARRESLLRELAAAQELETLQARGQPKPATSKEDRQ